MSDTITSDPLSAASEKPVHDHEDLKFPPLPDPTDDAFEEDISEEERNYYKNKFPDLNAIKNERLHCSACDRHLGCSARSESRMRMHPMLRTLVCHTCHTFYNSGEFDKGEDGSELYCRWCGQGGQVYCCSDCPVVFCAKCIKRNFGMPKIKEIENTDDWKCFKCNSKCLWDLRALCWALLRYCDLRNKITYQTENPDLKEKFQKFCAVDDSECCKAKLNKRKEKEAKKKDLAGLKPDFQRAAAAKAANAINAVNAIVKIPPTIQVKKFASINLDESPPKEKKPQKRSLEKDQKQILLKNPITISNKILGPPPAKKIRMPIMPVQMQPIRFPQKNYQNTYMRIRPKPPAAMSTMNILNPYINSTNMHNLINNYTSDNINLSLENLTQGLDMSAVAGMADNDVVCTPDFPLEPLCEVTEENNDDDVQCITPAPITVNPPPLVPRGINNLSSDNIIQMTENDVTVNAATGGLKFRVDPQTLSSNKMYRLPDGRVFAINANPNMPGGYSATIVALTENNSKVTPKTSTTYAAKLSAITTVQTPSPTPSRQNHTPSQSRQIHTPTQSRQNHTPTRVFSSQRNRQSGRNTTRTSESSSGRVCDLKTPVEWYRYNLIDAVDALEYSLCRLQKLKKEATTMVLRSRSLEEMRGLHKTLDNLLKTSSCRFTEIRENLNLEMKSYIKKKSAKNDDISDDDDDDVEILNDINDDPIFIDENSMESNNANDMVNNSTSEVDLTGHISSEQNDSHEKNTEDVDPTTNEYTLDKHKVENSPNNEEMQESDHNIKLNNKDDDDNEKSTVHTSLNEANINGGIEFESGDKQDEDNLEKENNMSNDGNDSKNTEDSSNNDSESHENCKEKGENDDNTQASKSTDASTVKIEDHTSKEIDQDIDMSEDRNEDTEITEDLIDSLLKDDNGGADSESAELNCLDQIPEDISEP